MIIVGSDYKEDGKFGLDTSREVFGTVGSWAGAYLLSSAMEEIGGYIGGNVYEYQPADPYQQYYERTK